MGLKQSSCEQYVDRSLSVSDNAEIAELITRAQADDQQAIGELLELYRGYLRSIARRRLCAALDRRLDASDLIQQTMLEAHQGMHRILTHDQRHLKASLRQILTCNVANAIRDHLNTAKRDARREHPNGQAALHELDVIGSPSRPLSDSETRRQLFDALDRLPDDQAAALRMRYFECASVSDIAAAFNRSRTAVAGLLKRGMVGLRQHFGTQQP